MSTTLQRTYATIALILLFFATCGAQQMRVELGEEKAAAVDSMLNFLFPGGTPVWAIDVFVQKADGTRTRISLTPVILLTEGSAVKFVAGIQEFVASEADAKQLRSGIAVSGDRSRETLMAATRDSSGVFHVIASLVLEPSHMLTVVSSLGNDPINTSGILITYKTIDVFQQKTVEVVWRVQLNSSLGVVRKYPLGVEIKGLSSDTPATNLHIAPTPTGISIVNPQTGKQTGLPCSSICEPSLQQLVGAS